jgi:hypothetical protein
MIAPPYRAFRGKARKARVANEGAKGLVHTLSDNARAIG